MSKANMSFIIRWHREQKTRVVLRAFIKQNECKRLPSRITLSAAQCRSPFGMQYPIYDIQGADIKIKKFYEPT